MGVIFTSVAIAESLSHNLSVALFSSLVNQELLMDYQVTFIKGLATLINTKQDHLR